MLFENTTLKGGCFCNLDIRSGGHVTVNGLTTINQVSLNDAADNGTVMVGLGIMFYYESLGGTESLTILNNSLTQYNWVANNQSNNAINLLTQNPINRIFSTADSKFVYTDSNNVRWVNTGILSLTGEVGSDNITTPTGYEWQNGISMFGKTGNLCTKLASSSVDTEDYSASEQFNFVPLVTVNKTGDTYSDDTLIISFAKGEKYEWNADKVTAKANGNNVDAETEAMNILKLQMNYHQSQA